MGIFDPFGLDPRRRVDAALGFQRNRPFKRTPLAQQPPTQVSGGSPGRRGIPIKLLSPELSSVFGPQDWARVNLTMGTPDTGKIVLIITVIIFIPHPGLPNAFETDWSSTARHRDPHTLDTRQAVRLLVGWHAVVENMAMLHPMQEPIRIIFMDLWNRLVSFRFTPISLLLPLGLNSG